MPDREDRRNEHDGPLVARSQLLDKIGLYMHQLSFEGVGR